MDRWYELNAWSRGHSEEVLREARMRHLVEQGRASRVPAWACVLSVLHGAGPSE
jgi:hypothetical protein